MMNQKLLSVHIDNVDQSIQPLVTIAVEMGNGKWMAYESDPKTTCTANISDGLFSYMLNNGGPTIPKAKAIKLFPNLAAKGCENL